MDRLIGTLYPDNGRITYAYDAIGQQTAMVDSDGSTDYEYDVVGRLTWVAYPIGQALSYSYDAVGNRTGMSSAQGITSYDYDAQDRLTAITNPYSETTSLQYDALDREVCKELANGVVISHTYDAAGRETVLEQRKGSGAAIAVYTATYDNAGNRTYVQELDGATTAYSYDDTYQLLSETRSGSDAFNTAFTYDGLGNRLTETKDSVVTSYTYDANNAVTTATSGGVVTTFSYDASGNRTGIDDDGTVTAYNWDAENRMIGVVNADSSTESFAYSGDGQRRRKTTDVEEVLYLWDEENVLAELNTGGGLIAQYTDNPGYWGGLSSLHLEGGSSAFSAPLGGMGAFNTVEFNQWGFNQEQSGGGSGDYYYLFDQSASTRYLVDGGGEVTDSELYRAFGERVVSTGNTRNPYRFQGEVGPYTDATNRVWMRARIYGPMAGQWYSTDPIGFGGGDWNFYRFVGNNPVNWVDPMGQASWMEVPLGRRPMYMHAYIQLSKPCPKWLPKVGGHSTFGFYASLPFDSDANMPPVLVNGYVKYGGFQGNGRPVKTFSDAAFEAALCDCISKAKSTGFYFFFRVCGSWVNEMWQCAGQRYLFLLSLQARRQTFVYDTRNNRIYPGMPVGPTKY